MEELFAKYRLPKKVCAWCEVNKLNQTYETYLLRGNICTECSSRIFNEYEKKKDEKQTTRQLSKINKIAETVG